MEIPFGLPLRLDAKLLFYLLHSVILTHFKSSLHHSWKHYIHGIIIWAYPNATSWELRSSCPTKKKKKEPGWHKESIAVSDLSQEQHLPHKKKHLKAFPLAVTIPLTILRQVWVWLRKFAPKSSGPVSSTRNSTKSDPKVRTKKDYLNTL